MSLKILDDGDLVWRNKKGKCHREKGPAIISIGGYIASWANGYLHRLDGPARIFSNGSKEYWIHGKEYSKEDYCAKVKKLFN